MTQRGIITDAGEVYVEVEGHPGWFTDGDVEFELANTDLDCPIHHNIDALASAARLARIRKAISDRR